MLENIVVYDYAKGYSNGLVFFYWNFWIVSRGEGSDFAWYSEITLIRQFIPHLNPQNIINTQILSSQIFKSTLF